MQARQILLALLAPAAAAATEPALLPAQPLLAESRDAALDCLATTIVYEAGREPAAGQEAVARVVLNRARHPAFPKTVCGVVYQGSSRRTGCQFTFTCDGSLARRRSPAALLAARVVAARVLDGNDSSGIGTATFYHADYVAPYWAPALVRVGQIGAHIFYRFPGAGLTDGVAVATSRGSDPAPQATAFVVWGLTAATLIPRGSTVEVRGN